jgi:hypothetical protein
VPLVILKELYIYLLGFDMSYDKTLSYDATIVLSCCFLSVPRTLIDRGY